jgi:hypothetical protein
MPTNDLASYGCADLLTTVVAIHPFIKRFLINQNSAATPFDDLVKAVRVSVKDQMPKTTQRRPWMVLGPIWNWYQSGMCRCVIYTGHVDYSFCIWPFT